MFIAPFSSSVLATCSTLPIWSLHWRQYVAFFYLLGCSPSFFLSFLRPSLPLYRACHSSLPPCADCVWVGGKWACPGRPKPNYYTYTRAWEGRGGPATQRSPRILLPFPIGLPSDVIFRRHFVGSWTTVGLNKSFPNFKCEKMQKC